MSVWNQNIVPKPFVIAVLVMAALLFGGLQVQAAKQDILASEKAPKRDPVVSLTQGMAEIVEVDGPVADIMVADPSVVDVMALQSNRLYLVGMNLGTTNLIALDETGNVIKRLRVHVRIDGSSLQDVLDELFPEEDIAVKILMDQIILTGTASSPDMAEQVYSIISRYAEQPEVGSSGPVINMMDVRGESQVMLRVRILEVARSALKELAIETDVEDLGNLLGDNVQVGMLGALDTISAGIGTTSAPFARSSLTYNGGAFGPLNTLVTAIEDKGFGRILAEPNLTTVSGQQASFLAGGQIIYVAGRDDQGIPQPAEMNVGVSLTFVPTVLSGDRISLQLQTEVAERADELGTFVSGFQVPGRTIKRAETTVEMGSGSALMIAGLITMSTTKNMVKLPGIADIPIIGDLVSSRSFNREESEVLILVSPYLVRPMAHKEDVDVIPVTSDEAPEDKGGSDALAQAFALNIRNIYRNFNGEDYFGTGRGYGYLID